MANPNSVHLVGSIPFESAEGVFSRCLQALPNRLRRIPDGEVGPRHYFVLWQSFVFPPQVLSAMHRKGQPLESEDFVCTLDQIKPTRYDEVAIESYATFGRLREEGIIPKGVRFQVSIPTPLNAIVRNVDSAYHQRIEPLYRERLIQDLRHLQDVIPAHDLAIQFDVAAEFAYLEYERGRVQDQVYKPHFSHVRETIMERIVELSRAIDKDVHLGFHLCYGDRDHRHFVQPEDAQLLVDIANDLSGRIRPHHGIHWIHMPVPKDRFDTAYFEPLRHLDIADTELFLGLVHAHDEEGTLRRLKVARSVYRRPFGVATECGMGRTPLEDIDSIFTISRNITAPEYAV